MTAYDDQLDARYVDRYHDLACDDCGANLGSYSATAIACPLGVSDEHDQLYCQQCCGCDACANQQPRGAA